MTQAFWSVLACTHAVGSALGSHGQNSVLITAVSTTVTKQLSEIKNSVFKSYTMQYVARQPFIASFRVTHVACSQQASR